MCATKVGLFICSKVVDEVPQFSEIICIYKFDNKIYLMIQQWTSLYSATYCAYKINQTNNMSVTPFEKIIYKETFEKTQSYDINNSNTR